MSREWCVRASHGFSDVGVVIAVVGGTVARFHGYIGVHLIILIAVGWIRVSHAVAGRC